MQTVLRPNQTFYRLQYALSIVRGKVLFLLLHAQIPADKEAL